MPAGKHAPLLPSPASLASLTALGALSALWALVLWAELVVARAGGTAFCAFGEASQCEAVWSSAFATAIHARSGLPVAGWGLVWSLVAVFLPLLALLRRAEGRAAPALLSATRLVGAAGALATLVLVAVSAAERVFCGSCALTYLLAASYAGIALPGWQGLGLPEPGRAGLLAGAATLAAFLVLLLPGQRTPRSGGDAGREAMAAAARGEAGQAGTGDPHRDRQLHRLVESLSPPMKQTLADSLYLYRQSPSASPPRPRVVLGAAHAPVRIIEFTDVRCEHCADLQKTLDTLRESLPPGSFSVEARQFPLDGECNSLVTAKGRDPVRCLAALARICLEGRKGATAFARALFEQQATLTREQVYDLAAPSMPRQALAACVASDAARRRLADDVGYASRFNPDGTPIVIVNGRRGTSFGPFLYAMALTGGADSHPAFDTLPPPNPNAHLH